MGQQVRRVIVGYDCPYHAIFLDAVVHSSGSTLRRGAICVFERESGRPLSRHFSLEEKDEMGAVKGYELVVRSISTVGNYDYLVSNLSILWHYSSKCDGSRVTDQLCSSTTLSSSTGRSKFAYLPRDTYKVDNGVRAMSSTDLV